MVRFSPWAIKVLGGCLLCTSTWLGIVECLIAYLTRWTGAYTATISGSLQFAAFVAFNAVSTSILYKLLK